MLPLLAVLAFLAHLYGDRTDPTRLLQKLRWPRRIDQIVGDRLLPLISATCPSLKGEASNLRMHPKRRCIDD